MTIKDNLYNITLFLSGFCKILFDYALLPIIAIFGFTMAFTLANEQIGFNEETINTVRVFIDLYFITLLGKCINLYFKIIKKVKT